MKSAGGIFSVVCILVFAGAAYFFYSKNQTLEAELAKLRTEASEVSQLREENAALRPRAALADEAEKLKKENTEVFKLRNEVRQLQKEKQTLVQKVQQAQFAQDDQQRALQQAQQLQIENERLRNQGQNASGQVQSATDQRNVCINNLKQLDGAKEQWALEMKKKPQDSATFADLIGADKYIRNMPVCPAGGQYTLHSIAEVPTCNMPGHQLPQ